MFLFQDCDTHFTFQELFVEHAPQVFSLTPLGRVVPVHLLVTHVAEWGSQLADARPRRPVALATVPVEAYVDEIGLASRLPWGLV